jgi:Flp pilus assembly protein TadG
MKKCMPQHQDKSIGTLSLSRSRRRTLGCRRGVSIVWVAFGLTVFLGMCALVIDEGYWFNRRGDMQKCADAAAMAGASELARSTAGDPAVQTKASNTALLYSENNGFKNGVSNITVTAATDTTARTFTVTVAQPARTFFGAIFKVYSRNISCRAVAQYTYTTPINLSITGLNYGLNNGPINLGL